MKLFGAIKKLTTITLTPDKTFLVDHISF
jgi:hypothetical protein